MAAELDHAIRAWERWDKKPSDPLRVATLLDSIQDIFGEEWLDAMRRTAAHRRAGLTAQQALEATLVTPQPGTRRKEQAGGRRPS